MLIANKKMPVEINKMTVKAKTIEPCVDDEDKDKETKSINTDLMQQIVEESVRQVMAILERQKDR